jgi:predicted RNase H-like HicB family nuclease
MKKAFTVIIERDPESGWLIGEVLELPGCYSQAPDLPTLEANMKEAISVYLQTTVLEEPLSSFVGTWQVEVTYNVPQKLDKKLAINKVEKAR